MKKTLVAMTVVAAVSAAVVAKAEDKSSGCGFGWQVAKENSLVSSFTRNLTNETTSNTFGMTSGTSGCDKHSIVDVNKSEEHFAEANYNSLMIEMAQGEGTYLTSLAYVMGCDSAQLSQFIEMSQKNYPKYFPAQGGNPTQMIDAVRADAKSQAVCQKATNT